MKTYVYSIQGFDQSFLESAAQGKHELIFDTVQLHEQTAHLACGCEAVALFTSDQATAGVLELLYQLGIRYVAMRSVGYDNVNTEKAKELGIKVANVPAYSPYAIAEHAVALLLALNRKLVLGQRLMRHNDFRLEKLIGFDLHGKTIGIVGTGKIGAAFARIMHGFGCHILAHDIAPDSKLIEDLKIRYTSLAELCQLSDVISICCPLNEHTKYLFKRDTFTLMRRGTILINTARGGLIHTQDLMDALDNGILSAVGLDVYEYEKPIFFKDHRGYKIEDPVFEKLRSYEQVLITGHQAFLTNEALSGIAQTTIDNLDQWVSKGHSSNEVY